MNNNIRGLLLVGGAKYHDKPESREMLSAFIGADRNLWKGYQNDVGWQHLFSTIEIRNHLQEASL
jgi:hypothetical protein